MNMHPLRLLLFAALLAAGSILGPAAAQEGSILDQVLKRGTIRIATEGGNPPYSVFTPSGEPEGYDIDIGNKIAEALKVKAEWITVDTAGRITALQTNKADITISDFTANVERSKVIAFTPPYLVVAMVFTVASKRDDLKTVEDLNDPSIRIGFGRGSTQEQIVPAVAPKATIVRFGGGSEVYQALQAGQIDAMALDNLGSTDFVSKSNGAFKLIPGNFSYEEIAIGLPRGDFDWWRILSTWMNNFNASGENAKLFKKWFGYDLPPIQAKY